MPDPVNPTGTPAETPGGPPSGRQRLLTALNRPARAQAVVAVLLAVVATAQIQVLASLTLALQPTGMSVLLPKQDGVV